MTVGLTFFEKTDSCLLLIPNGVSGWAKTELGVVESVKVTESGLVIIAFCSQKDASKCESRPTETKDAQCL